MEVQGIQVEVVRKDIKNLHVGVYPPNGRVRVAAPYRLDDEAIRLAIVMRLGWIRRQQEGFLRQDRQSRREIVTGETHYFQGRRYRLDVVEKDCQPYVELVGRATIRLYVRPGSDEEKRSIVLQQWYRGHLRGQLPVLLRKWEPQIGVHPGEVRIRKMKTRWGSCNNKAGRIWLNLELVKKPIVCLEYILVHEMVHLIERHHNERFRDLMDELMPQWRVYREELNRAPLGHEDWIY